MVATLLQLANGVGLLGQFALGRKRRFGFLLGLASEVLWTAWGLASHTPGIFVWCAVWGVIFGYGWLHWGRKGNAVHQAS